MNSIYPLSFMQLSNKYPTVPSPVHGNWNGLVKGSLTPILIKLLSIVEGIVGNKSSYKKEDLCVINILI